jgi:hypothetical protein
MIIQGMFGLGDNVYQRAFIKSLKKPVYLQTCWWQFYQDIPGVELIRPSTRLRTQNKNLEKAPESVWTRKKILIDSHNSHRVFYGTGGILNGMERCLKVKPEPIDLPDFGDSLVAGKYAMIRPVTIRKEWQNEARAPLPKYIAQAMQVLRDRGHKLVSVADLEDGKEWLVGDYPEADITFHHGELSLEQLMALSAQASVIVGGVGWIVPVAIAYQKKAFIVLGGNGAKNHPESIGRTENIFYAKPDSFCMCNDPYHKCPKQISDYETKLTRWLDSIT